MIARGLLDAGDSVVISSCRADAVDAADVSREDECLRLAAEVGGPLHVLGNNAGAPWGEPIETFLESAWDTWWRSSAEARSR